MTEPFPLAALQLRVAAALPAAAVTDVGAPGLRAGVTVREAAEAEPSPEELVAVTVKLYPLPLVSPDTVHVSAPVVVQRSPAASTTVYFVMGAPPSLAGAVHATCTTPSPGVTETMVGAPGVKAAVTLPDGTDAGDVPTALVAFTVNV